MAHLKIGNTSKGAVSAACLKQPSMNPQPTRKGFIFWITSPSGNLDWTSKSISAWNIFCLMPSRGELEHFDPPPLLDQKKRIKKYIQPPLKYISVGFFWYQCFVFFDPEYFFIPHSLPEFILSFIPSFVLGLGALLGDEVGKICTRL